jgi:hypothetical protein
MRLLHWQSYKGQACGSYSRHGARDVYTSLDRVVSSRKFPPCSGAKLVPMEPYELLVYQKICGARWLHGFAGLFASVRNVMLLQARSHSPHVTQSRREFNISHGLFIGLIHGNTPLLSLSFLILSSHCVTNQDSPAQQSHTQTLVPTTDPSHSAQHSLASRMIFAAKHTPSAYHAPHHDRTLFALHRSTLISPSNHHRIYSHPYLEDNNKSSIPFFVSLHIR